MRTTVIFALACTTTIFASGCTRSFATRMPNPLSGGDLQPNRIELTQRTAERNRGLPRGTLSQHASLSRLDDKHACFSVTLRSTANRASRVDPGSYDWQLIEPNGAMRLNRPSIERHPTARTVVAGKVVRYHTETERVCRRAANGRESCVTREVRTKTTRPGKVGILRGGGDLCFAHAGRITSSTDTIALRYRAPAGWRQFRWQF